jgi:hypothetical protein
MPSLGNIFQSYDLEEFLANAVAILLFLGGIFAVVMIIWGGFRMVLSGGKDDALKPAKRTVQNALLGVVALIIIIFLLPTV